MQVKRIPGEQEMVDGGVKKLLSRIVTIILMIGFGIFGTFTPCRAVAVPPLKGYINDYANMMSPETRARLEQEIRAFERTDSTQIAILTVPSTEGDPIEDFSIRVAEKWKIGQKGKDNGIILVVAEKDRKLRIEVGRGLEGKLTDLMAGRIIDLAIKPRFKRGDYNGGFTAGVHAMIDATRGEFKAEPPKRNTKKGSQGALFPLLIFGGAILFVFGRISKVIGGATGAVGLPLAGHFLLGTPVLTTILLGVAGLLIGIFLPLFLGGRGFGGGGGPWIGGGWSSGGYSGGGDSGGFDPGGGDFGGGGASGDW